jgi:phosphoglycolate phosphatase
MVGDGARLLVRRALSAAGLEETAGAVERFLEFYDDRLLNHTRLYGGIEDAVRAASAHARVVVLTNKPKAASERILQGLGVRHLFVDVVGGDGPLPRKPDPASLLALMQSAGADKTTTLMVGDSAVDHRTALNAGVRSCLVSYGFGFASFPREQLSGGEWIARDTVALKAYIGDFLAVTADH